MTTTSSFLSAITMLDEDPLSPRWRGSFERARSDEVARRYGLDPQLGRLYVDLHAKRDMTAAGVSGSNFIVGTSGYGLSLPSLQGASVAFQLGAQRLDLNRDNAALPVVDTAPTTTWLSDESTQISTSPPVIGSRAATPKTVAALVTFSHQLARQASPAVEALLEAEMTRALAAALDDAIFNGDGNLGVPLGILATDNVVTASGADIAWADIVGMVEDVTAAGAPMISPGFATTGAVREILMNRQVTADTGNLITSDANKLAGYPMAASNSGPTGALVFCDWSNVYVPTWGVAEILVNPFSGFRTGVISLRLMVHVDTLIAHPAAITVLTSVS